MAEVQEVPIDTDALGHMEARAQQLLGELDHWQLEREPVMPNVLGKKTYQPVLPPEKRQKPLDPDVKELLMRAFKEIFHDWYQAEYADPPLSDMQKEYREMVSFLAIRDEVAARPQLKACGSAVCYHLASQLMGSVVGALRQIAPVCGLPHSGANIVLIDQMDKDFQTTQR